MAEAIAEAARKGQPVEVESQTTETVISYAQPDGRVEVKTTAGPVRTKVDGEWVDVDTTLQFTDEGVRPVAVTGEITFSPGGTQPMVVLSDGESATLRLDWDGRLPRPVLSENSATYPNVLPQVDLVLRATRLGFEQYVVVKRRPDAATLAALRKLEFPIAANGAEVVEGEGGELTVVREGEVIGSAAAPVMWDARTNPLSDGPAAVREVGLELEERTKQGTDATLVLTPDDGLLAAADTVYPVTIDPTQALGLLEDTFVQNNIVNTPQAGQTELLVGTWNGGRQVNRSLLMFDVSAARNRVVESASLYLFESYSSSCTPTWVDVRDAGWFDPYSVTWNTQPWIGGIVGNAFVANGYSAACPANWVGFNLTGWVQNYSDARNNQDVVMPLAVTASSETDSRGWKRFHSGNIPAGGGVPALTFTYNGNCDQYYGVVVCGAIRQHYYELGGPGGLLGFPVTSEAPTPGGYGAFNHFERGSIYWSPETGAREVHGNIRERWAALGWEHSELGFPMSDEICGLRDGGCYSVFQGGSIYWTPGTGAWSVSGYSLAPWGELGRENGWLGYPLSDPVRVAGGTRSEFQGGNIIYDARAGTVTIGAGVLKHPTQFQKVTQARTQLKAAAPLRSGSGTYDGVKFQWRPYSLSPSEGWTDVESNTLRLPDGGPVAGQWLPVLDESGGKASAVYTWNATTSIPSDGLMQVRGCFRLVGGGERCTSVTQITVDRAGLTGANATSTTGPGTVSLLTGAYAVTGRDAEVTAPHGGLSATRSFASNDPNRAGPVGLGWRLSLAVDEAGADYESLIDRTDTVLIIRGDGTQLPFVRKSSAPADATNYVAEGEASTEGATLTFVPEAAPTASSYVLTDLNGDKVTFRRADGGNGHLDGARYRVEKVEAIRGKAGSTALAPAITSVTYTPAGNPQFLLAPTDAGVACTSPPVGTQTPGCRALEFVYNATSAGERLHEIRLRAYGAAAPDGGQVTGDSPVQAQTIVLSRYAYDTNNERLQSVTDPRTGQTVGYAYRTDGRIGGITPVGAQATWTLGYDDRTLPRLVSATLDDGAAGLAPQHTNVRYDLPLDGSNTALPTLTATEIGRWGQKALPTDMTAVFGPDAVPDASPTAQQWRGAQLFALDVNGRVVNTANYGGTVDQDTGLTEEPDWRISTTEYDPLGRGNVERSLTPGNRDRALKHGADAAAQAAQAKLLDTVNVYSDDGMDLLRSYEPARPVVVASGDRLVTARVRTTTTYDKGTEPGHPTPNVSRHLPVRTVKDAVEITTGQTAGVTGTEPGLPALDNLAQETVLEYATENGWKFGTPTVTRVNPGGGAAEVVTRQGIDEQGRVVTRTLPAGGTSTITAATTVKVYYSASAAPESGCRNEAWAGWLCKSGPGGTPNAGSPIPATHVTGYDIYGNVTRTLETGQGVTRTTSTAYDAAGRALRTLTIGTGPDVGLQRPEVETTYTATGLVETTRLIAADGTPTGSTATGTGPIGRTYDTYGRLITYTDGSGLVTTNTYDNVGRLVTVANTHGTRNVGYDGGGERGSLPTSLDVSGVVGTFRAAYGADGTLVREELPGGFTATTKRDAAGDAVSLRYEKVAPDGTATEWLKSVAAITPFDQVDSYTTTAATGLDRTTRYAYDNLGRLITATDTTQRGSTGWPTGPSCTRSYTFDANSNRTTLSQTATPGAPADTCPTSVPAADSYGYDTADRLQPDAGARGSLAYDALGRTQVLPAVDTVDQGGDVALDYYVDDLVFSMSQAGRTTTFGLDAAARRTVRTDTDAAMPGISRVATGYYSGDDDNPDVVQETDNSWTRNILSFGGLAAVVTDSDTAGATVTLQLANLHGDITATVPAAAASPGDITVTETTEYGEPRTAPAAGATQARYGWLGTHQRDASTPGGLTLMGVRIYAPASGRFLSVDPVEGGSSNDYDYANADPINEFDLDGRCAPACAAPLIGAGPFGWAALAIVTVGALALACQHGCAAVVPKPQYNHNASTTSRNSNRYQGKTIGYTIYRNGEVWKYGISSVGISRATHQLPACRSYGGVCTVGPNVRVFNNRWRARLWEYQKISSYRARTGHCPPGQPSCK